MTPLTAAAVAILRVLVDHIQKKTVDPTNPQTFLGYKEVHDALDLPLRGETYGISLRRQGLDELTDWTKHKHHPGITGVIVDKSSNDGRSLSPGDGYFRAFGKRYPDDIPWWIEQVRQSLSLDWQSVVPQDLGIWPRHEDHFTEKAIDFPEPPNRVPITIYRILRDTELARRVKTLHNYRCQICGLTIELPSGALYAEAHHIQPLGQPHNGPDIIGNILCLCPNHHAEVDYGVRQIRISALRVEHAHPIDATFVEYHNNRIYGRTVDENGNSPSS